ncbi:MAG: hypothetical protein A3A89_04655 [Candidatus Magasanikbacteria bacterium RIFCSPLOWO2_01_FULL_33_34]|nr:MAG: hypothetical protein A3B83_03510 [Candidatus Magasanikbacteria bacterium RIFCSPHIGHO2_02_FULL_33_17]OGH75371.1 MAG: hypothetical protein A3A89_04655 [Candidatus Magasanikbacteria bacterium RIFCSPLOWO2_01_FULL_33_34]
MSDDSSLPMEMVVGGRKYKILGFLFEDEESVLGRTMIERAVSMDANPGEEDGQHILDNYKDIPSVLHNTMFVITGWRKPGSADDVACLCWKDNILVLAWLWIGGAHWSRGDRVLRRE